MLSYLLHNRVRSHATLTSLTNRFKLVPKTIVSINVVQTEDDITCCPLCEVDLTDTKTLQHEDKHCVRIAKLITDPKSRFNERDSYGYDNKGISYHINRENGKEYKATVV